MSTVPTVLFFFSSGYFFNDDYINTIYVSITVLETNTTAHCGLLFFLFVLESNSEKKVNLAIALKHRQTDTTTSFQPVCPVLCLCRRTYLEATTVITNQLVWLS